MRAEFNENGRDIEEETPPSLTTFRTILKPICSRERERNRRRRLSSLIPSNKDPIRIKIEEGCWNGRYYGNFYRRGWWRWFRIEVIFLQELSVLSFRYDKCCRGEAVLTYPFVERNRKGGRNCGICFFLVRSFQSIYAKFNSI